MMKILLQKLLKIFLKIWLFFTIFLGNLWQVDQNGLVDRRRHKQINLVLDIASRYLKEACDNPE